VLQVSNHQGITSIQVFTQVSTFCQNCPVVIGQFVGVSILSVFFWVIGIIGLIGVIGETGVLIQVVFLGE